MLRLSLLILMEGLLMSPMSQSVRMVLRSWGARQWEDACRIISVVTVPLVSSLLLHRLWKHAINPSNEVLWSLCDKKVEENCVRFQIVTDSKLLWGMWCKIVSTADATVCCVSTIPGSNSNMQEAPFALASGCILPLLPRVALMVTGKGCLHGALRSLHYLPLCHPLVMLLEGSYHCHWFSGSGRHSTVPNLVYHWHHPCFQGIYPGEFSSRIVLFSV